MEKIYAAPLNADYYAVFVGDKKLTLPLSELDAKKIADRYNGFEELEQENKRLALQNEILSGAYETSQKREKDLMAEKEELLAALIRAEHEIKHAYNGAPNFAVITKAKIRAAIEKSQGIFNPADLDEI